MEYVKLSGLRLDGRRPTEIRHIHAELGTVSSADGSAIFEMGNTKVIAAVYGPREIDIYFQVLQADGGTRSACINAATLALADAGIPMCDLVTSCSAGYLNSTPLLDLNYLEDSAGGPDVTVGLLAKLDKVTLLQVDAKLPIDIFENVLQLAIEGCKTIANLIRQVLLENTQKLEYLRGT